MSKQNMEFKDSGIPWIGEIPKHWEVIRNKYDNNSCIGIDLGVNNLCAITSNDKPFSYVINGRPLKSINQYYNKKLAEYRSDVERFNKKETSKRIRRLIKR